MALSADRVLIQAESPKRFGLFIAEILGFTAILFLLAYTLFAYILKVYAKSTLMRHIFCSLDDGAH